jgi:hypothetical protein
MQKLYELDSLYEDGGLTGLVALASPSSDEAGALLSRELTEIIVSFRIDLHFEGRPTKAQSRAALSKSPLAGAVKWLKALDPDTRRELADEAHREDRNPQRELRFVTGEDRLAALEREYEFGARLVQQAQERLQPGKAGRPLLRSVHDAVHRLHEAWTAANASKPKLSTPQVGRATGAFLDFVRAVLNPAIRAHGIKKMDFERAVRDDLYNTDTVVKRGRGGSEQN